MNLIKKYFLEKENANDEFAIITNKLFSDNDEVQAGDLVLEYETSKASFELHVETKGYIKYHFEKDDIVNFGDTLIELYDK